MKSLNPLIQLNRQLHYLFVAFLFTSFAVAQSAQAEPDEDSPNVAKSAAMGKAAKNRKPRNPRNQQMILFDYTTAPVICAFNERVQLNGKIRISFTQNGTQLTASLENFEGVGLTTKREYVADTVTLAIRPVSSISPGFRLLLPSNWDFAGYLTIAVTGKHPIDLNSATGDPLPGKDVHFQLNYNMGWGLLNGKVAGFSRTPDNEGIISCY